MIQNGSFLFITSPASFLAGQGVKLVDPDIDLRVLTSQGFSLGALMVQTQVAKSNSPLKLVDLDLDLRVLVGQGFAMQILMVQMEVGK
jgi:hypothetical protein